ncbi:MAG: hypothetical protein NC924_05280 [Candidatus Omnitrophica bacterium]|nr:hypothetical protein [Candidatus Omnitrophota bacterium]
MKNKIIAVLLASLLLSPGLSVPVAAQSVGAAAAQPHMLSPRLSIAERNVQNLVRDGEAGKFDWQEFRVQIEGQFILNATLTEIYIADQFDPDAHQMAIEAKNATVVGIRRVLDFLFEGAEKAGNAASVSHLRELWEMDFDKVLSIVEKSVWNDFNSDNEEQGGDLIKFLQQPASNSDEFELYTPRELVNGVVRTLQIVMDDGLSSSGVDRFWNAMAFLVVLARLSEHSVEKKNELAKPANLSAEDAVLYDQLSRLIDNSVLTDLLKYESQGSSTMFLDVLSKFFSQLFDKNSFAGQKQDFLVKLAEQLAKSPDEVFSEVQVLLNAFNEYYIKTDKLPQEELISDVRAFFEIQQEGARRDYHPRQFVSKIVSALSPAVETLQKKEIGYDITKLPRIQERFYEEGLLLLTAIARLAEEKASVVVPAEPDLRALVISASSSHSTEFVQVLLQSI